MRFCRARLGLVVATLFVSAVVVSPAAGNLTAEGPVDANRTFNEPTVPNVMFGTPIIANLAFEAIGDPIAGGSWFQDFGVHSPTAFSNLGMMLGSGYPGLVGSPAMSFSDGGTAGWTEVLGPPSGGTWPIAASAGPATTDVLWRAHFVDPMSQGLTMTLFAYDEVGSNIFDGAVALWDGSEWHYAGVPSGHAWEDYQDAVAAAHTPVPSAVLLGALGLCLVGPIRKRFT